MTIRKNLLALLLPPLIGFLTLISLFFYYNWSREILEGFQSHLQSVVISSAVPFTPKEIDWLSTHVDDPKRNDSEIYKTFSETLNRIRLQLPVENLYVVRIDDVKSGEPVLLDKPISKENPPYDGNDPQLAYRQVFLLDASAPLNEPDAKNKSRYDFSETKEHDIYKTKKSFVTPIYTSKETQERFMSGFAPILNQKEDVIALLGADLDLKLIDKQLHNALMVILFGGAATILLAGISVFLIASKFSKPIQKLNSAALAMAAGQYGDKIEAEGPKEIKELANTLNTMSECLDETMERLQENALVKEWMVGEFECSQLLQHHMLKKVVEDFKHPNLSCRLIQTRSGTECYGVSLNTHADSDGSTSFVVKEAKEQGFLPIYNILSSGENNPSIPTIKLNIDASGKKLTEQELGLPPLLVWSQKNSAFVNPVNKVTSIQKDDLIILYGLGFSRLFENREAIERWFNKVLKHFASEGLDALTTMLNNELSFQVKRQHTTRDLYLLIFRNSGDNGVG